jgi:hypothetical protein
MIPKQFMSQPKQYLNGCFINSHKFNDGGEILKLWIPAGNLEGFCAQLKAVDGPRGTRLCISALRSPNVSKTSGKVIATHSIYVDTYEPRKPEGDFNAMRQAVNSAPSAGKFADVPPPPPVNDDQSDIPF